MGFFWKTSHLYLIYYAGGCNANKGVWGFISYLPYKYFSMKKYASLYFFRTVVCSVSITANEFVKIIFSGHFISFLQNIKSNKIKIQIQMFNLFFFYIFINPEVLIPIVQMYMNQTRKYILTSHIIQNCMHQCFAA